MIKIAHTCIQLGDRVSGPESQRYIDDGVREYQRLLALSPRASLDWARIQNGLGNALESLGERGKGTESIAKLNAAVAAYQQALTVCTRETHPGEWAKTQNNLGVALKVLGTHLAGPEMLSRIRDAVDAYTLKRAARSRAWPS